MGRPVGRDRHRQAESPQLHESRPRTSVVVSWHPTSVALTGLTSSTSYSVVVRAENVHGDSHFTPAVTCTPS
ncbi:MAG: fibronectin type III domain-containing protein [bacterium]|nr:fibronectin type III domain-containing protein [bacterium]